MNCFHVLDTLQWALKQVEAEGERQECAVRAAQRKDEAARRCVRRCVVRAIVSVRLEARKRDEARRANEQCVRRCVSFAVANVLARARRGDEARARAKRRADAMDRRQCGSGGGP